MIMTYEVLCAPELLEALEYVAREGPCEEARTHATAYVYVFSRRWNALRVPPDYARQRLTFIALFLLGWRKKKAKETRDVIAKTIRELNSPTRSVKKQ